jgi:hypothetical protein
MLQLEQSVHEVGVDEAAVVVEAKHILLDCGLLGLVQSIECEV